MEPSFDVDGSAIDTFKTKQIIEWVRTRWKLDSCRVCGWHQFQILAQVTLRYTDSPNVLAGGNGPVRPCAGIVCTECGTVLLLDLLVAGVFRIKKAPDEPPPPTSGPYR